MDNILVVDRIPAVVRIPAVDHIRVGRSYLVVDLDIAGILRGSSGDILRVDGGILAEVVDTFPHPAWNTGVEARRNGVVT